MSPTITEQSICFVNKTYSDYTYGDIALINSGELGQKIIKRIIACPGDTVQFIDKSLYINNKEVKDIYSDEMITAGVLTYPITLQENEYIVLGDNRNHSVDSRTIGPISKKDIIGKIFVIN